MSERYLSTKEFMGVARVTVIKWIKQGKITAYNINGKWKIPYSEVERLFRGISRFKRVAIYTRVSGSTQKLEKQTEALKLWITKNLPQVEYIVIKDIASGLKEDRRGLKKLIELAKSRQIDAIIIAYKDRLTRFGFEYLKELFKAYGVEIIVAFQEEPKDYMQELVEDMIEIITSFASRIYGKRSHKYEKLVGCVGEITKDTN